jgi:membrane associated rhomboid family serine protease
MIPLKDTTRSTGFPVVTVGLIVVNIYVFWLELTAGPQLYALFERFAVVPAELSPLILAGGLRPLSSWPILVTLTTATFLHGSWLHIIGNMLYLWVFGDNVEGRLSPIVYLGFYLIAGALGNLAHVLANPASTTPTIGASGAVAGVLGAYLLMFPRARVLALIPLGVFFTITEVRATFFLLLWFGLQLLSGLGTVAGRMAEPVAWWAHVGGFVIGVIGAGILGLEGKRYA